MIATVLAHVPQGNDVASWRQLVDLVVQARGRMSAATRTDALGAILDLRSGVPVELRRRTAESLAERCQTGDAVAIFASDDPQIAAPAIAAATLSDEAWTKLIPVLPSTSRALLRNRRDLSAIVYRALQSYGASDFGLPPSAAEAENGTGTQIRDLVARIEAFRQTHPMPPSTDELVADVKEASGFVFETGADAALDWVSGAPREALIGLSIGDVAEPGGYGVDGQAAGAFRRRAPFRDARLRVGGAGPASGDWRITAAPIFNPRDGRFAGYHGSARRPRIDETTEPVARLGGTTLPVDSLRTLIHELRTPLNAILGFAEMIDRQVLGPAASAYRTRAHDILTEAQRLVALVDDLDSAARDTREPNGEPVDPADAIRASVAALEDVARTRQAAIAVDLRDTRPIAGLGAETLERMLARLGGALLGVARPGETMAISGWTTGSRVQIALTRPTALAGLDEAALLDARDDDGAMLALGFTLRLIANMARGAGGVLSIGPDAFVLGFDATDDRKADACL